MASRAAKAVFIASVMVVCAAAVAVPSTQGWFYDDSGVSETSFSALPLLMTRFDDPKNTAVSSDTIEKDVSEDGFIGVFFTNTCTDSSRYVLDVEAAASAGTVSITVNQAESVGTGIELGDAYVVVKVTGLAGGTAHLRMVFHITDESGGRLI